MSALEDKLIKKIFPLTILIIESTRKAINSANIMDGFKSKNSIFIFYSAKRPNSRPTI